MRCRKKGGRRERGAVWGVRGGMAMVDIANTVTGTSTGTSTDTSKRHSTSQRETSREVRKKKAGEWRSNPTMVSTQKPCRRPPPPQILSSLPHVRLCRGPGRKRVAWGKGIAGRGGGGGGRGGGKGDKKVNKAKRKDRGCRFVRFKLMPSQ